jgi:regulator of protease activity HflC (stomatin/prohibitin superfamily)
VIWFVIAIILALAGIGVLIGRIRIATSAGANDDDISDIRRIAAVGAAVLIALAAIIVFFDSFTIVPPRSVGIVTTFGRANAALDSGFHWVSPWSSVDDVDATVQNVNLDNPNCVTVRLANQTTACVDITLQWSIDQHANANELWQRYRGTNDNVVQNVGHNVVERELQRALNVVFGSYNPLAVLSNPGTTTPTTASLAAQALALMQANVDPGINVGPLLIAVVHYDATTQSKLNGYAQALADTQIATQQKLTAEQQREANDLLNAASSNDPGVEYQNCLNLIARLAASGQLQDLPPTFNCNQGGQTPVIVGSK